MVLCIKISLEGEGLGVGCCSMLVHRLYACWLTPPPTPPLRWEGSLITTPISNNIEKLQLIKCLLALNRDNKQKDSIIRKFGIK